ncbi:MAG: sugar phosphate isomerase/epimerase family protein, partial [Gemmatimonadales bacterium]
LRELAAIGNGEGIGFTLHEESVVNAATALPEERSADAEKIRRLAEVAARLSSPVLAVHPGVVRELDALERHGKPFATPRYDRDSLARHGWERAVERIAAWADIAASAGITLVVENEVHTRHTAAPTAEALAAIVEAAGRSNVRVNFDTGHAYIGAGLAAEFAALEPYIAHVHLNDNTSRVSDHLPLGAGKVDFLSIASFLATVDAALVIEIYAPDRPEAATLESRDYLLRVIAAASESSGRPGDRKR